ncbi:uncharacterized protein BJ171DRAFT_516340 [Polychytrium aggregatum]|uniref:uncharacterized protein n=1 Tax=Polychytrium aggregatum TaxID=110093 RepID=UPI0022FE5BEC|nr:uncharacterized protein BJ171DRAFT_516340 [Polychytrium aggregatum]KAI9202026.1 hypothetical protein BJ171DRAFT_516340 [Polychytrium aggregatum]
MQSVAYLSIFAEDAQLLTYFLNDSAQKFYYIPDGLVSFCSLRYDTMLLTTFLGYYIASVLGCLLMIFNAIYVAVGFARGKHKHIWPISTLRLFASTLPTILYSTILKILLSSLSCSDTVAIDPATGNPLGFSQLRSDQIWCYSVGNVLTSIISILMMLSFIPISWVTVTVYLDMNPIPKANRNKSHARFDIIYTTTKTVLTIIQRTSTSAFVNVICSTVLLAFIFANFVRFFPFYNKNLNMLRAAMFSVATFAGALSSSAAIASFAGGINPPSYYWIIILLSAIPSAITGGYLAGRYINQIQKKATAEIMKISSSDLDSDPDKGSRVFRSWSHVEICARFVTEKLNTRKRFIAPECLGEMKQIFKRGIREYPYHTQIRLQYASYMFYLTNSQEDTVRYLKTTMGLRPPFDVAFQIHLLHKITRQVAECEFLGSNVKLNVTEFIEFQQLDQESKKNHGRALMSAHHLWNAIKATRPDMTELEAVSIALHQAASRADASYIALISRFSRSQYYLQLYAKFCFYICNDALKSSALLNKAKYLKEQSEQYGDDDGITEEIESGLSSNLLPMAKPTIEIQNVDEDKSDTEQKDDTGEEAPTANAHTIKQPKKISDSDLREIFQLRMAKNISVLRAIASLSGIASLVFLVANYFISSQLFQNSDNVHVMIKSLGDIEYYAVQGAVYARQIDFSYEQANNRSFLKTQSALLSNSLAFQQALYVALSSPALQSYISASSYLVTPSISLNITDEAVLFARYFGLQEVNEMILLSGSALTSMPVDDVSQSEFFSTYFRLAVENLDTLVSSFSTLKYTLLFPQFHSDTIGAGFKLFFIGGGHVIVLYILLIYFDLRVYQIRSQQMRILRLLTRIPHYSINEILSVIRRGSDDGFNVIDKMGTGYMTSVRRFRMKRFRINALLYFVVILTLTVTYGTLCYLFIKKIGQQTSLVDEIGRMLTSNGRMTVASLDIINNQMFISDTSFSLNSIKQEYTTSINGLINDYTDIMNGDPTYQPATTSFQSLQPDVFAFANSTNCLPLNTTLCQANITIQLSSSTIVPGQYTLLQLQDFVIQLYSAEASSIGSMSNGAAPADVVSDLMAGNSISSLFLSGGWTQCKTTAYNAGLQSVQYYSTVNLVIFSAELFLILVAQLLLFNRIISQLEIVSQSTNELLIRLPSGVKSLPEILAFIRREFLSSPSTSIHNVLTYRFLKSWIATTEGSVDEVTPQNSATPSTSSDPEMGLKQKSQLIQRDHPKSTIFLSPLERSLMGVLSSPQYSPSESLTGGAFLAPIEQRHEALGLEGSGPLRLKPDAAAPAWIPTIRVEALPSEGYPTVQESDLPEPIHISEPVATEVEVEQRNEETEDSISPLPPPELPIPRPRGRGRVEDKSKRDTISFGDGFNPMAYGPPASIGVSEDFGSYLEEKVKGDTLAQTRSNSVLMNQDLKDSISPLPPPELPIPRPRGRGRVEDKSKRDTISFGDGFNPMAYGPPASIGVSEDFGSYLEEKVKGSPSSNRSQSPNQSRM